MKHKQKPNVAEITPPGSGETKNELVEMLDEYFPPEERSDAALHPDSTTLSPDSTALRCDYTGCSAVPTIMLSDVDGTSCLCEDCYERVVECIADVGRD